MKLLEKQSKGKIYEIFKRQRKNTKCYHRFFKGKKKKWYRDQMLYWQGEIYPRDSQAYQDLLDRAFAALATNEGFRKALLATGNANLTHSIGKNKITETVLTRQEFCSRLMNIRERIKKENV